MSNGHIVSLFDRWERLEAENADRMLDIKEFFGEAKGLGYDTKALKVAFKARANKDNAAAQEHTAMVDLYLASFNSGEEE